MSWIFDITSIVNYKRFYKESEKSFCFLMKKLYFIVKIIINYSYNMKIATD